MTYEPYHRKYRPKTFSDVVGQDAVGVTLRNALKDDRVANAFLFSGSRGVGKTSMARIFAKALNCPEVQEGEPCGGCDVCISISRGDDIDVIEVDGASNRGIDEIRAIRDNVGYAPARARFKVYIIDEVHMLTTQAFNALLKTLEEPPPHVKFVFATTEPQAVLDTIVSRCQRYEFRRISLDDIVARLMHVASQEGLSMGEDVLREIAVKSEGGLRDSLSLLDQLVSFAGAEAGLDSLDQVLGRIDTQVLGDIVDPMARGDTGPVLDALDAAFESGRDAEDVLAQVTELLREAMVREARGLPGGGDGRRAELVTLVREHFPLDRVLLAMRLCLNAHREIKLAGQGRVQVELTFLKISRSVDLLPVRELMRRLDQGGDEEGAGAERRSAVKAASSSRAAPAAPPREQAASAPAPSRAPETVPASSSPSTPVAPPSPPVPVAPERTSPPALEIMRAEWTRVVDAVRQSKPRAASLIRDAVPDGVEGTALCVRLPAGSAFKQKQLESGMRDTVEDAIRAVFGIRLKTSYVVATAEQEKKRPRKTRVLEDPSVRRILDSFGGDVVQVDEAEGEATA